MSEHRRALDVLYRRVHAFFQAEDFAGCDRFLLEARVEELSVHELVGLLTVTAHERERLPSRGVLVGRVRSELVRLAPSRVDRLMRGLE